MIAPEASAQLDLDDQVLRHVIVVGDLDGDGVDDAIARTSYGTTCQDGRGGYGGHVYVVYGGRGLTGQIDLATRPSLTGIAASEATIAAVGDVDGDGLADVVIGAIGEGGCAEDAPLASRAVYLVYGSTTRLTGVTRLADAGVSLRDAEPGSIGGGPAALGDLDGDGMADFAISRAPFSSPAMVGDVLVFYGRSARFSGTVDLASAADATIALPSVTPGQLAKIVAPGDVDGDGDNDFLLQVPVGATGADTRLIGGGATRMAGSVALDDVTLASVGGLDRCAPVFRLGAGTGLGDLDGDGLADFSLISCAEVPIGDNASRTIMVQHVFYGRAGGFPAQVDLGDADATLVMTGEGPSNLASGDIDGDGVRDLIVSDAGAHHKNGAVHVIKGNHARLSGTVDRFDEPTTYVGTPVRGTRCDYVASSNCVAEEQLGASLDVGDVTGDGILDILVTAPTDQLLNPNLGVHGSALGHGYVLSPANP